MLAVAALVLFLIVRDPHRRVLAFGSAALAAVAALVAGPMVLQRFSEASVNGGAGRTDIWHVGWIAFTQNWLFGAGFENFAWAYDRAYMQVFQPFYTNWHRAPHNVFLGTAVDLGIIGLGLMLLAWISQFKLLDFITDGDARFGLRITLQASVVALVIVALFSDIMISKYTWLLFMLIVLTRNTRMESAPNA
jgi:O-antigen ligase